MSVGCQTPRLARCSRNGGGLGGVPTDVGSRSSEDGERESEDGAVDDQRHTPAPQDHCHVHDASNALTRSPNLLASRGPPMFSRWYLATFATHLEYNMRIILFPLNSRRNSTRSVGQLHSGPCRSARSSSANDYTLPEARLPPLVPCVFFDKLILELTHHTHQEVLSSILPLTYVPQAHRSHPRRDGLQRTQGIPRRG